jgi:3-oxoacyl-[acyl-carrier-protein] synthase-3
VAASLPSALDAAIRGGRLRRGETALLIGSGAGMCLGGAVLRY